MKKPLGGQADSPERMSDSSAGERLAARRKELLSRSFGSGSLLSPGAFPQSHTDQWTLEQALSDLMDEYFRDQLARMGFADPAASFSRSKSMALVAVGGYGRSELCPQSDIDIVIVCRKSFPPQALDLAQPLFLPLWDMGADLGHGFRTIRDCLDLALDNNEVLASLLDMRHVAGDKSVFEELDERFSAKLTPKRRRKVAEWLRDLRRARLAHHGDSSAMVEPHLKEGVGGLRDYHTMLWLGRLLQSDFLEPEDSRLLERSARFLLRVRSALHHVCNRRNDVLHLELQPQVAEAAGFGKDVEGFLTTLHRSMTDIKGLTREVLLEAEATLEGGGRKSKGGNGSEATSSPAPGVLKQGEVLSLEPDLEFPDQALALLRLFKIMAGPDGEGLRLSRESFRHMDRNRPEFSALYTSQPLAVKGYALFREILVSGGAGRALRAMLESGFLALFIPEFKAVQDLVQFDGYHIHPVGRHSVEVVAFLEELDRAAQDVGPEEEQERRGPVLEGLWRELDHKLPLLLAALFHDMGKDGPEHEKRGADIARQVMRRWDLDQALIDEVVFLVENHLLLAQTAQRRDLGDESVVLFFAGQIGALERLVMLSLMTYADSRATGPKAWNDWAARLFAELRDKASRILRSGALLPPHAAQRILATRDKVRAVTAKMRDEFAPAEVEEFLDAMDSRYTLAMAPERILRHMTLARELAREKAEEDRRRIGRSGASEAVVLKAKTEPGSGLCQLTVAAMDQPGLFATLTGVFALHGFSIYSADIFTLRNGLVLDIFQVSAPKDPLFADETWARVRSSLKYALAGKLSVAYRLEEKRKSPMARQGAGVPGAVSVNVDNAVTDFHTVVEVKAPDRLGLLYEIAHSLHSLRVDIHMAKVSTHGLVSGTFYVHDAYGQKMEDPMQVEELRRTLTHRLTT